MNKKPIKQIRLTNFQSHKDTVLELSDGVNVIVGPSDVGKTAILRALRWVFFNEPRGDYFIRHGFTESSVELVYQDGTIVRRKRASNFNGYEIEKDGNIEKYSGMGASVPKEVIDITGVKKFEIEDGRETSVNFQTQLEGAFLLADTPLQKAKSIGAISNVNSIDEAIKRSIKKDKDNKNQTKRIESELDILDQKIQSYSYLEELKNNLKLIKDKYLEIDELSNKLELLKEKALKLKTLSEQIYILDEEKRKQENILSIKDTYQNLTQVIDRGDRLYQLFSMNKKCNESIIKQEKTLEELPDIYILKEESLTFDKQIKEYQELETYRQNLVDLIVKIEKNETINKQLEQLLNLKPGVDDLLIISENRDILNNLNNSLISINKKISDMEAFVKANDFTILNEPINYIIDKYNLYLLKNQQLKEFTDTNSKIIVTENRLNDLDSLINIEIDKYIELIKMSKKCPFCGSEITEEHISKFKEELYNDIY